MQVHYVGKIRVFIAETPEEVESLKTTGPSPGKRIGSRIKQNGYSINCGKIPNKSFAQKRAKERASRKSRSVNHA